MNVKFDDQVVVKTKFNPIQKVLAILSFLSFAGIMLSLLLFMDWFEETDAVWVLSAEFGLTFFLIGLTVLMGLRTWLPAVFVIIGAAISAISLTYGLGDNDLKFLLLDKIVPILGISLFPIVGMGIIIGSSIARKKKAKKYCCEIKAKIIDKETEWWTDSDHETHTAYRLTWEYYFGGAYIKWRASSARKPERREIGDYDILMVDPMNPHDAIDVAMEKMSDTILSIVGITFTVLGIAALAALVYAKFII